MFEIADLDLRFAIGAALVWQGVDLSDRVTFTESGKSPPVRPSSWSCLMAWGMPKTEIQFWNAVKRSFARFDLSGAAMM